MGVQDVNFNGPRSWSPAEGEVARILVDQSTSPRVLGWHGKMFCRGSSCVSCQHGQFPKLTYSWDVKVHDAGNKAWKQESWAFGKRVLKCLQRILPERGKHVVEAIRMGTGLATHYDFTRTQSEKGYEAPADMPAAISTRDIAREEEAEREMKAKKPAQHLRAVGDQEQLGGDDDVPF